MPDDDNEPASVAGEIVSEAFDGPGDWLPPADAARRIGVSERTLWRRVTAGQYRREVRAGRAMILVPVAGTVPNDSGLALPDNDRQMSLAVIEELRRQHDVAEERLTRQADRIAALERENGKLTAERDAAEQRLAEEQAQAARSWLDRLLRRT